MPNSNDLSIRITATDLTSQTFSQLQAKVRNAQESLKALGGTAKSLNADLAAGLNAEIAALKAEIAARKKQAQGIREVTSAFAEQGTTAARSLAEIQQGVAQATVALGRLRSTAVDLNFMKAAGLKETIAEGKEAIAVLNAEAAAVKLVSTALGRQAEVTEANLQRIVQAKATAALAFGADPLGLQVAMYQVKADTAKYGEIAGGALEAAAVTAANRATRATYREAQKARQLVNVGDLTRAASVGVRGSGVTELASGDLGSVIMDRVGRQASPLGMTESNSAFASQLSSYEVLLNSFKKDAGETVQQTINRVTGVGASRAPNVEALKTFQAAGLTATETALGMTEASVALAAAQEKEAEAERKLTDRIQAQMAARQRLRDEISIPTPPEAFGATSAPNQLPPSLRSEEEAGESAGRGARGAAAGAREAATATGSWARASQHIEPILGEIARGNHREMFASIGAAARDAGLSTGTMVAAIGALSVAFAAMHVAEKAEELGRWVQESQAAAAAAGMSAQAYTELQGALQGLNLKANSADNSLRMLSRSLGEALANPTTKAASAFHALGISQQELVSTGGNTRALLDLLANAFQQTADGANKTAAMEAIAGRGFETLIPLLNNGSVGLDDMTTKAKALGVSLDPDGALKLTAAGQAVAHLGLVIEGQGIQSMEKWSGSIIRVANALETVVHDGGAVLDFMAKYIDMAANLPNNPLAMPPGTLSAIPTQKGSDTDDIPTGVKALVPALRPVGSLSTGGGRSDAMEQMRLAVAQAVQEASGRGRDTTSQTEAESRAAISVMQNTLKTAQLTAQERTEIETELAEKQTELANEVTANNIRAAHQGTAEASKAAQQSYADFASAEKDKIAAADGSMSAIAAIYDEWLTAAEGRYKQHASVIADIEREKTQAVNSARLEQIKQGAQDSEAVSRANFVLNQASAVVGNQGDKSDPSQLASQANQINAQASQEITALKQIMDLAAQGSQTQREAAQEILSVITESKQKEVELYQQAAQETAKASQEAAAAIDKFTERMGGQFQGLSTSLLDALIAPQIDEIKQGLTTIKINERGTQIHEALQKFAVDMVNDATTSLENAASQFAAQGLSQLLKIPLQTGASGLSGLLSSGLQKVAGIGIGAAGNGLNTAQFGLATTQLQTAATTLQAAATALSTTATASGAGGALGAGAGAASTGAQALVSAAPALAKQITTPIVATTITASTSNIAGHATTAAAINAQTAVNASGLTATALKPSLFGFSYAGGGIVPSAAGGMIVGGNGATLAMLHTKEMVLPSHLSQGIQGLINGGGGGRQGNTNTSLNYAPTINTSSRGRNGTGLTRAEFSQMMSSHGGALLGEARNMMRSGWRPG